MRTTTTETVARIEAHLRDAGIDARGLAGAVAAYGLPVEAPVPGYGVLRLELRRGEVVAVSDGRVVMTADGPPRRSTQPLEGKKGGIIKSFRWPVATLDRLSAVARRLGQSENAFVLGLLEEALTKHEG